jgi:group I intron endonuclease
MFYVYCIQNSLNFKIYVGKTSVVDKRFYEHNRIASLGFSKGNVKFSLLHKALAKYGKENFTFQVIEEFEGEQDCLDAEKFWIEFFRTDVNRFGNEYGYNLTADGDGISGYKHSEETKNKISLSNLNKIVSIETKLKQSFLAKENCYVDNIKNFAYKECIVWPSDDELIKAINSTNCAEVGRVLGVSKSTVLARVNKRNLRGFLNLKRGKNHHKL